MLKTNLSQQRTVTGNEPIILDQPQIWLVTSGSLAVFATQIVNREPQGSRHYLFSVSVAEALVGIKLQPASKPDTAWGLIAVALEATVLEKRSLEEIATGEAVALIDGWLKHLASWWVEQPPLVPPPINQITASNANYLSLLPQQGLLADSEIIWVDVREGTTRWLGLESCRYSSDSPLVPLAAKMWLEAEEQVEVYACSWAELETIQSISPGLQLWHQYFFDYFDRLQQRKLETKFQLFQAREQLNQQMAAASLGQLAAVLEPQAVDLWQEGTALLVAAGAVGKAQGIMVQPPKSSEDVSRAKNPLEIIARASQFRIRRVLLAGKWWQQEYGPLLGYTLETKQPVALLPDKSRRRYLLFDPETRTKQTINETVADSISPEAYMFYRPLDQKISNALGILQFGIQGYQRDIFAIVLFGLIVTLLGMITPQAIAILINNAIPDSDRLLLAQIGLALFAAAFGKAGFELAQNILTLRVENAADGNLQPAVWDRLLNLSPAFFRRYASGDLLNRLLAISLIREQLSGATQRTLLSGVFALLNLLLMFVYSVQLAFVGLGIAILVMIVTVTSTRKLVAKQRQQEEIDGEINSLTVELINGVAKLRVAAAEERAFAAWADKYSYRSKLTAGIQRINDSLSVFNETLPLISSILIFWFAILFIQLAIAKNNPSSFNAGTFLAFNAAFAIFLQGATDLSNTMTDILEIVPLWERAKPIMQSPTESDPTKADPGRLTGRLSFDHVTFRYREDGPLILDDVSFFAKPGEFIAFVGPSGSGKSTIFRLLLGFEIPLSGTVYYDGQDLAGLEVQALRRQLGVVLQNVRISYAAMYESIGCGALVTLDEVWEAARMAGLAEDIEQMPMGMHTVISEGGSNLSGGQKQRLLIARALVLKPKIILMDEATSALDNRTQAIVSESLEKLNATRIVIAHRLSTIRNADRIYVVESGRVVQVGNFEELVQQEGLFARLAARQLD